MNNQQGWQQAILYIRKEKEDQTGVLSLAGLGLKQLPPQLYELINLSHLDLSSNSLTSLPGNLIQLTNLSQLNLQNNKISCLPEWLKVLPLETLLLQGNPILSPITEGSGELSTSISVQLFLETYFKACKPLHEVKLLLIGERGVGKTSIANWLMNEANGNDTITTKDLIVNTWFLPLNDQTIQINIWDFGGHEINHLTYQFFCTKRSIYLIIISGRDDIKVLDKWLEVIQGLTDNNAPIIVVVSKIDEHYPDIDEHKLKSNYPQIKGFVYLSYAEKYELSDARKQAGCGTLITYIKQVADSLPHTNNLLHKAAWDAKYALQNMKDDLISYEKFLAVCTEFLIETHLTQKTLAELLNDLGMLTFFSNEPYLENAYLVLNPKWIINAVYTILNNEQLKQQKGRLSLSSLREILDETVYPIKYHHYLLQVMCKFQICLSLPSQNYEYLIPTSLPSEQPDKFELFQNSLALTYHYTNYLPNKILFFFITKAYKHIDFSRIWQTGCIFQFKEGNDVINEALIKSDEADRKLYIWLSGKKNTSRDLLAIIRDKLAEVHEKFSDLPVKELWPVVNAEGKVLLDRKVQYNVLRRLEAKEINICYDPHIDVEIDVQASLNMEEVSMDQIEISLRDYLSKSFSVNELKILTDDLMINLEGVINMNQGSNAIVRDLVKYTRQINRLIELRIYAYKQRQK